MMCVLLHESREKIYNRCNIPGSAWTGRKYIERYYPPNPPTPPNNQDAKKMQKRLAGFRAVGIYMIYRVFSWGRENSPAKKNEATSTNGTAMLDWVAGKPNRWDIINFKGYTMKYTS